MKFTVLFSLLCPLLLLAQPKHAEKRIIKVGEQVADFCLEDEQEKPYCLKSDELEKPIMLFSHVGHWNTFTTRHIRLVNEAKEKFKAFDIIVITSENHKSVEETRKLTEATFPILIDPDGLVLESLGLDHVMQKKEIFNHQQFGLDIPMLTNGGWMLAHPAILIIDTDGKVRYAYTEKKKPMSVKRLKRACDLVL